MSGAPTAKRLEGKVAIITGGASGIGESAVRLFHEHGAKVILADIKDDRGRAIAAELGGGTAVTYIHCDVSLEDDMRNLVDAAVSRHGKLDIMYSNAGIIDRTHGSILDTEKSDLDRVLRVNLGGAFLAAKHAARVMVPRGEGCILFTSSSCTSIAGIATHSYAASKYGIWGLARNTAAELGRRGIRVNCVSPFAVITGIAPEMTAGGEAARRAEAALSEIGNLKGRVLKAEGVAKAALYLASDEADYVSGMNLVVDGGFSVVNPSMEQAFNLLAQ